MVDSGTDKTGLGRWSWYKAKGEKGHKSYVITAYAPCGNATLKLRTYYKQHERYIKEKNINTTPKAMFQEDLLNLLRTWHSAGDRVVLMMDAN